MPSLPLPPPQSTFSSLDPALPLALLPVRMETRFYPGELRVRLYPDVIHADAHVPALTETEQQLGRAYWRRAWGAPVETADTAFRWLSERVGPWRAAWVAKRMTPTNLASAPKGTPRFPTVETAAPGTPARARLLPERFAIVGYHEGAWVGTWWGARIPDDPIVAPGFVDAGAGDVDARAFLQAQGLDWAYDFERAEAVGLGVRIDLDAVEVDIEGEGFSRLIAIGVRAGDQRVALEALLSAQRYTRGLDFIAQGTPTNATETAASGATPDPALVRATELDPLTVTRPAIPVDGDLLRLSAADAASLALGLGPRNALDRAAQAGLDELERAWAMATTLWFGAGSPYFPDQINWLLPGGSTLWLRDWAPAFVRGAAPLPTLLVGPQPYGLLPVTLSSQPVNPTSEVGHLEDALAELRPSWEGSLPHVPHLDPDATDALGTGATDGERTAVVSQVLGALPHPTAFRLAQIDDMREDYTHEWYQRRVDLAVMCMYFPDPDGKDLGLGEQNVPWTRLQTMTAQIAAATSVSEQLIAVRGFEFALEQAAIPAQGAQEQAYADLLAFVRPALVDFIEAHDERTYPLSWVSLRIPEVTRMMGETTEATAFYTVRPFDAPWQLPLVGDVDDLHNWLSDLREGLDNGGDTPTTGTYGSAASLLYKLVTHAYERAFWNPDSAERLAPAFEALEQIDDTAELERMLREALGPWTHRLDAWYTSVAAWRLEGKRRRKARGVQVGAYGWLVDVKPRETKSASQGYVLTPSSSHGTTAAILRAGWSAFGEGLEVDLSSDKIRRARWIVEGVHRGQDLARLIGARFERELQEAGLPTFIATFRQLALDAAGSPAPPNEIIDGLLLARARSGDADLTDAEDSARIAIEALIAGATAAQKPKLRTVLASLEADLDAAADASVAQSVYSLTEGNTPEVSATLAAASTGDVTFPHLRFTATPRAARTITHRLVLMLDPAVTSGWKQPFAGARATASPALEAWAAALLGDPASYTFNGAAHLGQVGISALDAIFLAPAGEQTGLGTLGALLETWAGGPVTPGTKLADLAVAGRALRQLLAQARDLDGRDVAAPGATEPPAGIDATDLPARVTAVRAALRAGRQRLAAAVNTDNGLREAIVSLAGFQLSGAFVPAPDGKALLAQIDARLAQGGDDDADRLKRLLGHALPLATRFTAANGAELDASFARPRLSDPTGWLAAVGRAEPGAGRLRAAVDLAEAALDRTAFDFRLAQLPDHPREGWAARTVPTADERSRLCLLTTGAAARFAGTSAAGLVLAAWTEALPRGGQTAGLAVHFDAPSARAPQALLLCTVKDGQSFDFERVYETVDQTLLLAKLRTVGPETLQDLGQYLPAVYLPGDTNAGGEL